LGLAAATPELAVVAPDADTEEVVSEEDDWV